MTTNQYRSVIWEYAPPPPQSDLVDRIMDTVAIESSIQAGHKKPSRLSMRALIVAAALAALTVYAGNVIVQYTKDLNEPAQEQKAPAKKPKPAESAPAATSPEKTTDVEESLQKKKRKFKNAAARAKLIRAIKAARLKRLMEQPPATDDVRGSDVPEQEGPTGASMVKGNLSKEVIQEAVHEMIPEIKTCYETVLEEDSSFGGRLAVYFKIIAEPDIGGVIEEAEIDEDSDEKMASNETFTECIIDSIYELELPAPENGGEVEVTYPFMFSAPSAPPPGYEKE